MAAKAKPVTLPATGVKAGKVRPKGWVKPTPLKFSSMADAKKHIEANELRVVEHVTHRRGDRLQVVLADGKVRTITVVRPKDDTEE